LKHCSRKQNQGKGREGAGSLPFSLSVFFFSVFFPGSAAAASALALRAYKFPLSRNADKRIFLPSPPLTLFLPCPALPAWLLINLFSSCHQQQHHPPFAFNHLKVFYYIYKCLIYLFILNYY
jgi:hypothetical protein